MIDYKNYSDQQLVILLKKKDRLAFTQIYNRYFLPIFYKVNQMLRNQQISEDIVQEVFEQLWLKSELLQEYNNLGGYLYICSRNSTLKVIQKNKLKGDYLSALSKYATDISFDTVNEISERELGEILKQEINKLPVKMRIVFEMSRNEDFSHAEIAQKLGISVQTVSKQVSNALSILKTRLSTFLPLAIIINELAKKIFFFY